MRYLTFYDVKFIFLAMPTRKCFKHVSLANWIIYYFKKSIFCRFSRDVSSINHNYAKLSCSVLLWKINCLGNVTDLAYGDPERMRDLCQDVFKSPATSGTNSANVLLHNWQNSTIAKERFTYDLMDLLYLSTFEQLKAHLHDDKNAALSR